MGTYDRDARENMIFDTAAGHQSSDDDSKTRKPRGFAAMDRRIVSEIAKKGGQAAHRAGTAHEFTSEEARVAGRKGGQATHARRITSPEGGKVAEE